MDGEIRREQAPVTRKRDNSMSELIALREAQPDGSKERQIVDKRIELSKAQHDNTGSWKGEYFGRDIRDGLVERGLEPGPDGLLPTRQEDLSTHFLLVNMGELDRVNAMGDHSSGDKALEATAKQIRDTLKSVLKDDQFDVYRTAGNDFSVRLKRVDRTSAERINAILCGKVDLSELGQDAAPIESSLASQSDLIDVINSLESLDRETFLNTEKPEGPSIGVLKELLQQQNDRQKTESRMRRMQEVLEKDPATAQEFYEKYQRKVIGPIFHEAGDEGDTPDFEVFKARFAAADEDHRHHGAQNEARRQYAGRRETQRDIDRALSERAAKQTLGVTGFQKHPNRSDIPSSEKSEDGFVPPKPTRGFQAIADKRKNVEDLKAAGADTLDIELASLDAEIEAANRESMTGLAQRGRMFSQLENGLESGKPVGVVYIDLAFLKYFDKEGNKGTADVAIKKAAELLDGIAIDASKEGILVEAYRIGGDEFALGITGGGDDATERVKEMILTRQEQASAIPLQGEKALGTFSKQKLSFNFGSLGPLDLEGMRKLVTDNRLPMHSEPGSAGERNELAEYALRFADKQLEIQKGYNRIGLLISEKRIGESSGDMSRYEQLLKYSQKAIFDKEGVALINELSAGQEDVPGEQVLKFVIDQIKKKGESKRNYETSVDRIIDERVRELYFEQRINSLKHQITALEGELSKTKDENVHLKQKVAELEQEVQNVSSLKQRILAA